MNDDNDLATAGPTLSEEDIALIKEEQSYFEQYGAPGIAPGEEAQFLGEAETEEEIEEDNAAKVDGLIGANEPPWPEDESLRHPDDDFSDAIKAMAPAYDAAMAAQPEPTPDSAPADEPVWPNDEQLEEQAQEAEHVEEHYPFMEGNVSTP